MVKRVVDTDFWTDKDVIDNYSPEDKYFFLYLISNGKSSQVGIYPLPVKVISFETGYSTDAVQVLLERFSEKYKQIIYSKETQEVTILNSLRFSILKGGRPVRDLLEKELTGVKDVSLIQDTYDAMEQFWILSKRPFDKTVKEIFETELMNRAYSNNQNLNANQEQNENQNQNHNESHNDNHNHNEESWATNRGTNCETNRIDADEHDILEHYAESLKKWNPNIQETITADNIAKIYYREMIGDMPKYVETQLKTWEKQMPTSVVIKALSLSVKANHPLPYAATVIESWLKSGVKTYSDILELNSTFNKEIS